MITRRTLLRSIPVIATASVAHAEPPRQLRIGYQKSGILLVAKQQQYIENRLRPLGVSVSWTEFSFGPPMLEALRLGSLDFGTVGDTPPIFAQAAHADLLYVAVMRAGSASAAILLPPGSTLQTLADLKGKPVAFARGSAAHNLTVAALEKAGLAFADIQPIQLAPADAAAAFARGNVDAWAIWDPYYAIAEVQPGVRVLATSRDIAPQNSFYLSSRRYVQANAAVIEAVIDELGKVAAWSNAHRPEVAQLLADGTGVPLDAMQRAVARSIYAIGPVTDEIVAQQQQVADRFYRLGLIPARIAIADATWRPTA
ncbi:MAG: aliphatic sulfonate ABC transporter substrate-binding protein [Acetobacteraceae bacterium]|jgi:aliphatic sulfonates family ABC transporter substrate-binding protein